MLIDDDMTNLLVEIGMIAARNRMKGEAEAIASALQSENADSVRPSLIRALALLHRRDPVGAVRELEQGALKRRPQDAMANAFLALALHIEGRASERDRVATEVLDRGGDESALALAASLQNA